MSRLMLTVEAEDADSELLNRLTKALYSDLRATGLVTVTRRETVPPTGAKSGVGMSVGQLVVSGLLSASTMSALAGVLIAYMRRTGARAVIVRRGNDEYRFTGLSAAAQRELIDRLVDRCGHDHDELAGG